MEVSTKPAATHRPVAISIVCLLGFAWWAYVISVSVALRVFNLSQELFPVSVPAHAGGPVIFEGICIAGIWRMRQWGVLGYVAIALFHQIAYYLAGQWEWGWLIVPLLVIGVGILYYKRMQ